MIGPSRDKEKQMNTQPPRYCTLPPQPVRALPSELTHERQRAIIVGSSKWVNGTVLHFYFFDEDTDGEEVPQPDGSVQFVSWVGAEAQREVVRRAFETWQSLPLGLRFEEVGDRNDAEIRIGFMDGDGAWSYVGRGILQHRADARTMNFGWDLTRDDYGMTTALHEIGHTLGLPHEHQNPFAGIVWDEPRVYEALGGPPNFWPRDRTFHNILRKLNRSEVEGSEWDPDSVMHYSFGPGLILEPAEHRDGISPPGTLSPLDRQWARKWYPGEAPGPEELEPFRSVVLSLGSGEQRDFLVVPPASRRYEIATFGSVDTLLVLFEEVGGELRYLTADDDSGHDTNARISIKLLKGRRYVLRLRLYWAEESGMTAVMYW
jgi:hypothetical protein